VEELVDIPTEFTTSLSVEFQDRLRARWSGKQQAIIIEQRVGKNILPSLPRISYSDERRQSLAEGYMPIMTVAVSETMRCPSCNLKVNVPNRETKQIRCLYCQVKGRKTLITAGYYPLNSFLIEHLKSIDPLRNMDKDMVKEMNERNEKMLQKQQEQLQDNAIAYSNDNFNRLVGIQQTGYTGKIKAGTEVKGF
jgi:hypothetical protein